MVRIRYEKWEPGLKALETIRIAEAICADYATQGYDLTLRQLYYQFVARGHIANNMREYKRLGDVVNKARLAGLLDWDYITDRTRNLQSIGHFTSPANIIDVARNAYRVDKWSDQPTRVEVWIEKEALAGVVQLVAQRHDVAYFACRGYVSQSEQWGAAQRLGKYITVGQNVVIIHLGDHDPSGIDMTRDIEDRIRTFLVNDWYRSLTIFEQRRIGSSFGEIEAHMSEHCGGREPFVVNRIALNMDQVEQYQPPSNPAKMTDSRVVKYIAEYGDESWELDALDPATLDALIEGAILEQRDEELWDARRAIEDTGRAMLGRASARWAEIEGILRDQNPLDEYHGDDDDEDEE